MKIKTVVAGLAIGLSAMSANAVWMPIPTTPWANPTLPSEFVYDVTEPFAPICVGAGTGCMQLDPDPFTVSDLPSWQGLFHCKNVQRLFGIGYYGNCGFALAASPVVEPTNPSNPVPVPATVLLLALGLGALYQTSHKRMFCKV